MARRVIGKVELYVEGEHAEVGALFDAGATKSYVSFRLAERMGYSKYAEPKETLLAVENKTAYVVGDLLARVLVNGCELPVRHAFGVIDGLRHDVIIGMDLMEPYEVVLDVKEGKVGFKRYPPVLEII